MFALLLSLSTHAETLDEARLAQTMRSLAPLVEAEAGRRFDGLPALRLGTRATVLAQMRTSAKLLAALSEEVPSPEEDQRLVELVDTAMAIYSPGQDTVWVVTDHMEAVNGELTLDAADRASVLHCVLAHELTHGLQNRYVHRPAETPAEADDHTALAEGQASLVARRVCQRAEPPSGLRAFYAASGLDSLLAPGPDVYSLRYLVGTVYVARVEAEGGKEAVWQALAGPAPTEAAMRAAVTQLTGRAWVGGHYSRDLLAARFGGAVRSAYLEQPAEELRDLVTAGGRVPSLADVPATLGGEVASWSTPGAAVWVVRVALDEPTAASAWMERRAAALTSGGIGVTAVSGQLAPIFVTPVRRPDPDALGGGVGLWLSGRAKARYDEAWAVRGGVLAGVSAAASRGRDALKPEELAALLADALVPPEPGVAGLPTLLAGSPPPEPPTGVPLSVGYVLLPALLSAHEGDHLACARRIDALAEGGALPAVGLEAGWRCALEVRDPELSTRLLGRIRPEDRPRDLLEGQVLLLAEVGKLREALALLDTVPLDGAGDRAWVADLRISLAARLKDWRLLATVARHPDATPRQRAFAGSTLYAVGRYREALDVLRPVCGYTEDPDLCRWLAEVVPR